MKLIDIPCQRKLHGMKMVDGTFTNCSSRGDEICLLCKTANVSLEEEGGQTGQLTLTPVIFNLILLIFKTACFSHF